MDIGPYSEKANLQLVNAVFKLVPNKNWITTVYSWMTNSQFRIYTRLNKFLKDQIDNPDPILVEKANEFKKYHYDRRIIEILKFVHKHMTYIPDKSAYKMNEYWALATESLKKRIGDCDDFNSLIHILARLSGIPAFKLYSVLGDTVNGYHYYLLYMAGGKLYAIDGTYWVNYQPINFKPEFKITTSKYTSVDYIFNDRYIFKMK